MTDNDSVSVVYGGFHGVALSRKGGKGIDARNVDAVGGVFRTVELLHYSTGAWKILVVRDGILARQLDGVWLGLNHVGIVMQQPFSIHLWEGGENTFATFGGHGATEEPCGDGAAWKGEHFSKCTFIAIGIVLYKGKEFSFVSHVFSFEDFSLHKGIVFQALSKEKVQLFCSNE